MRNSFKIFKSIVKKILPDFILNWLKVYNLKHKGAKPLCYYSNLKKSNTICVIGNGPSLKNDLIFLKSKVGLSDFICVNQFAESEQYEVLKPNFYFFLDGAWFSKDFPFLESIVYKTLDSINDKTKWEVFIFVPFGSDLSIISSRIKNKEVKVKEFGYIPINYSSRQENIDNKMFKNPYAGPVGCNVINYTVYLSLLWGYEKVYITGLDMSIYRDIVVDQDNNEKYLVTKHFYEEDKKILLRKNPERVEPWKMYELYHEAYLIFKTHDILNNYAKTQNIKIINKSSFSLIDSYDRA